MLPFAAKAKRSLKRNNAPFPQGKKGTTVY
jgi:hypothetical protein